MGTRNRLRIAAYALLVPVLSCAVVFAQPDVAAADMVYDPGGSPSWDPTSYGLQATDKTDTSMLSGVTKQDQLGLGNKLGLIGLAGGAAIGTGLYFLQSDYKQVGSASPSLHYAKNLMKQLTSFNCNGVAVNPSTATYTEYGTTDAKVGNKGVTGAVWEPLAFTDVSGKNCFVVVSVAAGILQGNFAAPGQTTSGGALWGFNATIPATPTSPVTTSYNGLPFDNHNSPLCQTVLPSWTTGSFSCTVSANEVIVLSGTNTGAWNNYAGAGPITGVSLSMGWSGPIGENAGGPMCVSGSTGYPACVHEYTWQFPDPVNNQPRPVTETVLCETPGGSGYPGDKTITAQWMTTDQTVRPLSCQKSIGSNWFPRDVKICINGTCSEVAYPAPAGTSVVIDPTGPSSSTIAGVDTSVQPNRVTSTTTAPGSTSSTGTSAQPQTPPSDSAPRVAPIPTPDWQGCVSTGFGSNPLLWELDALKIAGEYLFVPCALPDLTFTGATPQMNKWTLPTPDNLWPGEGGCGGVTIALPHKYFNDWTHTYLNTCEQPYAQIKQWTYSLAMVGILLYGVFAAWNRLASGLGVIMYSSDPTADAGQGVLF